MLLAVVLDLLRLVEALAANLHAGVQLRIDLEFELQDEVAVVLVGAQKRVARVGHAGADDLAVFDAILGLAAALLPAVERLAVEQRPPFGLAGAVPRLRRSVLAAGLPGPTSSIRTPSGPSMKAILPPPNAIGSETNFTPLAFSSTAAASRSAKAPAHVVDRAALGGGRCSATFLASTQTSP